MPSALSSRNPNAKAVEKIFSNSKASTKNTARERNFSCRTGGIGRSLHNIGSSILAESESGMLNSASQFARLSGGSDASMKSCFLLACRKQLHDEHMGDDAKRPLQNIKPSALDHQLEYQKNYFINRHEATLPRRRAVDPFLQLTEAQQDLHMKLPSSRLVDSMSGSWIVSNPSRQQLSGKTPLMTRIMRGDFYEEHSNIPKAPRKDFVSLNRVHVRAASAVSRLVPEPGSRNHCHSRGSK